MRHVLRLAALTLLVGALQPNAAAAAGWLERMSGPGPYRTVWAEFAFPVLCYGWKDPAYFRAEANQDQAGAPRAELFGDWDCRRAEPDQLRMTFGVDVLSMTTGTNPLAYAGAAQTRKPGVRALMVVPYLSVPLTLPFEAGAGAGFMRLTDRGSDVVDFSTTKLIVQPVRLTFKPLALFSDDTRLEFLQLALNGTIVMGTLDAADFGAVPGTFSEKQEFLWQAALRIDVLKLLVWNRERSRRR